MMRNATDVAGQALVPVLVAGREGMLDMAVHDAPKGNLPTGGVVRSERLPVQELAGASA
jgi:hypothetical protein